MLCVTIEQSILRKTSKDRHGNLNFKFKMVEKMLKMNQAQVALPHQDQMTKSTKIGNLVRSERRLSIPAILHKNFNMLSVCQNGA